MMHRKEIVVDLMKDFHLSLQKNTKKWKDIVSIAKNIPFRFLDKSQGLLSKDVILQEFTSLIQGEVNLDKFLIKLYQEDHINTRGFR